MIYIELCSTCDILYHVLSDVWTLQFAFKVLLIWNLQLWLYGATGLVGLVAQDVYVPPTLELGHDDVQRARPAHYVSPGWRWLPTCKVHIQKNCKTLKVKAAKPAPKKMDSYQTLRVFVCFCLGPKNSEVISSGPSSVDRSNGIGRNATSATPKSRSRSRRKRRKACQRPRPPRPGVFF